MDEEPIYEDEIYDIEYEMFLLYQEIPDINQTIIPNFTNKTSENIDGMVNILFDSSNPYIKKLI